VSSLQPSTVVFDIDDTSLWVIFTAQQPKTEAIRSVHPALSYGDSDADSAD
jgi:acid phosphatase class B